MGFPAVRLSHCSASAVPPLAARLAGAAAKLWEADIKGDRQNDCSSQRQLFVTHEWLTDASIPSEKKNKKKKHPPQKFLLLLNSLLRTDYFASLLPGDNFTHGFWNRCPFPLHTYFSESGVWLPFAYILTVCRSLTLRDATEVPLNSCWRGCEQRASRLRRVGAGRFD